MTNIRWLHDPQTADARLSGGKAANLARLWDIGIIPPGFVIAADAADEADAPDEQIRAAYRALGKLCAEPDPAVAVRSSAVYEDGASASLAGQYETVLNVRGEQEVLRAVAACRRGFESERVRAYADQITGQQGSAPGASAASAVLVQQMVPAARSAVVFSANPVTGCRDEVIVEMVDGLGDGLVGGQVTPERFVIPKSELSQHKGDAEAVAAARLAVDLEGRLGYAVDVECAFDADGRLFLLQCRAITTIAVSEPVEFQTPADEALTWTLGRQAFPDPLAPLVRSYLPYHLQGWRRDSRRWGYAGSIRLRFYHGYYYTVWEPAGLTTWEEHDTRLREAERTMRERWEREYLPRLQADHARVRALPLLDLPDADLALALEETLTAQVEHFTIHAHLATVPYSAANRLVQWYVDHFPGAPDTDAYRLLQGLPNLSVDHGHSLWRLSQMVTPAVERALAAADWDALPGPFRAAWQDYLREYGHRANRLADPTSSTWTEDPAIPIGLVLEYARGGMRDPKIEQERLTEEREAFTAQVRERIAPGDRAEFEDLLASAQASYALTEDHSYWIDQQSSADVCLLVREFSRRMAGRGAIDDPADTSFLTLHELIQWGFGLSDPLRPLIRSRKEEHAANLRFTPPDTLGAPPQPVDWVDRFNGPSAPLPAAAGTIQGVGASAGKVRGRARVVRTLEEAGTLQPGEILVCVSTDVNWTPFFAIVGGLVTDTGGSLAHAAVVAREYHLPAVVGAVIATSTLHTGQELEIDGLLGTIRVLGTG